MKEGYLISKSGSPKPEEMEQINRLSRRNLLEEEVFVFSVVLCDNEIDRDFERFSVQALYKLSELYIGKTGVFDHSAKGRDQTARIYSCRVEQLPGQTTKAGEAYHRLLARAYMPKLSRNQDLITEIDAGIKKEVSVGCAVGEIHCSVCGADMRNTGCTHVKGRIYQQQGKECVCHAVLSEPTDAYEWSFVAVPAQPQAGVVKAFGNKKGACALDIDGVLKRLDMGGGGRLSSEETMLLKEHLRTLENQAQAGAELIETLKNEVVELGAANHNLPGGLLAGLVERMTMEELKSFQRAFRLPGISRPAAVPQLLCQTKETEDGATEGFRI